MLTISVTDCAIFLDTNGKVCFTSGEALPCKISSRSSLNCLAQSWPAFRVSLLNSSVSARVYAALLQVMSMSDIDFLAKLAAAIISSCLLLIPAATDLAVALVMALVQRMRSSGVTPCLQPSEE